MTQAVSEKFTAIDNRLYEYLSSHSLREPDVLRRLREETAGLGGISVMQISPEQGQLMQLLLRLIGAKCYLEVGTFTGYSALACAMALPEDGTVITCDVSREWAQIGQRYWEESGMDEKIDLCIGPAAETLKTLLDSGEAGRFDAMFIDADKTNYETYYEYGLQLVRPGGLIMIDNVLWGGAVADPVQNDADTQAIRALNVKIHRDDRVDISMVPIADGLTLARKK